MTRQSGADAARIVGIERIDAVVVRRDIDDVPDADAGNVDSVDVQGLRVDLVVDGALEQLAELADVDVRRREDRLGEVRAGPLRVVMVRDDACLRECRDGQQRPEQGTMRSSFVRSFQAPPEQEARHEQTAAFSSIEAAASAADPSDVQSKPQKRQGATKPAPLPS